MEPRLSNATWERLMYRVEDEHLAETRGGRMVLDYSGTPRGFAEEPCILCGRATRELGGLCPSCTATIQDEDEAFRAVPTVTPPGFGEEPDAE